MKCEYCSGPGERKNRSELCLVDPHVSLILAATRRVDFGVNAEFRVVAPWGRSCSADCADTGIEIEVTS